MPIRPRLRRGLAAPILLLAAAACTDRHVLAPETPPPGQPPAPLAQLECRVDVRQAVLTCSPVTQSLDLPGGIRGEIVGGQDVYVKITSSGTSYDSGTEILQSNLTVQNLLQKAMGTSDGTTVTGVDVFFATGPTTTAGTGTVTVNAPTGTFTAMDQPYFHYSEILSPFEVSSAMNWTFDVPSTVEFFSFTLLVSALTADEDAPLRGSVWTGAVSTDWTNAGNWEGGIVPDSASTVDIPTDSLVTSGNFPVLQGNVQVTNLRVGSGSSLTLAGFTLTAWGNVAAVGTISGGTVRMTGAGTDLNGNVDALVVTGSTSLQGATKTTGAVSIQDGSLTVADRALSIQVP
jgi:hypothetical protein